MATTRNRQASAARNRKPKEEPQADGAADQTDQTEEAAEGFAIYSQFPTSFAEAVRADYDNHNRVFNHIVQGDYVLVIQHIANGNKDVLLELRRGNEIPDDAIVLDGTWAENVIPQNHPVFERVRTKGIGSGVAYEHGDPNPNGNGTFYHRSAEGFIVPELSQDAEHKPEAGLKPPL